MAEKTIAKEDTNLFPTLPKGTYFYATGKRKTAVARVRLYKGTGNVMINGREMKDHIKNGYNRSKITSPLSLVGKEKEYDIYVKVLGGGDTAQAEAIRHGVARALVEIDANFRPTVKKAGMLRRDARTKERKKFGLKRARRSPQWAKR